MKTKAIIYWILTALLALGVFSGGVSQLMQSKETLDGIMHLGYPLYFVIILGVWKVLGAVALVVPRFPRLKEWAYAGIFFEMTGAAASHIACGDPSWHAVVTLAFAAMTVASWALRPPGRTLGVIFGGGALKKEA